MRLKARSNFITMALLLLLAITVLTVLCGLVVLVGEPVWLSVKISHHARMTESRVLSGV